MGLGYRNLSKSEAEFTKTYSDIKGVDFSGSAKGLKDGRLPYMENMYRDYSSGDFVLESIPGYRELFKFDGRINAIFCHKVSDYEEYILVHAGMNLYRFAISDKDSGGLLAPIATLKNTVSSGFSFGEDFFLLDGEKILIIDKNGDVSTVSESGRAPYIPTRFKDFEEYEQANLLTDKFKEEINLKTFKNLTYGTSGLIYSPAPDGESFTVIGADPTLSGVVYIPSSIKVAGEYKEVTAIADLAFSEIHGIDALITNDGLKTIGANAFKNCKNLRFVVLSDTVTKVGAGAFAGCELIYEMYLGTMLKEIGAGAMTDEVDVRIINYAGAQSEYALITGGEGITDTVNYGMRFTEITLDFAISTPAVRIDNVLLNGVSVPFLTTKKDGYVVAINIVFSDKATALGSTLLINGTSEYVTPSISQNDIRGEADPAVFADGAAIKKCTKAALFDGRIFLCGNPDLPNTVFFSSAKNPLYFGSLDYFNDGTAGYSVRSLLPAQDSLIVFKSGDDGGGSIFYHKREDGGAAPCEVSYPAIFANNAIPALGRSCVFYDDALFISELGLCALEKSSLGGVNAVCRSHNVNQRLLAEDFEGIRLTSWQGYLVLACGERMYLADSRRTFRHESGATEYEWFYLSGIGAPKSTQSKCIFHSTEFGSLNMHPDIDTEADSSDYYVMPTFGYLPIENTWGVNIGNKSYHAYFSEELVNQGLYKCTDVLGVGELLLFGCENGSLMVFNNDKRGVVPERLIQNDPTLNVGEYGKQLGQRIHPDFYSFAGYAPRYVIKTGRDSCAIPHLAKNTTPASVTVKIKSFGGGRIRTRLDTDRQNGSEDKGFSCGGFSFESVCFANLSFESAENPTVVCFDAPRLWVEKEITLISDEFRSPMGIYSISYRFKIKGRIKKR